MNTAAGQTPVSVLAERRRKAMTVAAGVLVLVALLVFVYWYFVSRHEAYTDNAYVAGHIVQITPQVEGTVVAVHGDDTDRVEQGQILVELDAADARVALQAAEANLADTVRAVRGLYSNEIQSGTVVGQKQADLARTRHEVDRASAEWQRAADDLKRQEALFKAKFISAEALQSYRTALQSAEASLAAAKAAASEAEGAVAQAREQQTAARIVVDNTNVANHPRVQAAAAQVRDASLALARTRIPAPVAGYLARRSVQLGQRVTPGAALMAVIPELSLWVDANFKETDLDRVRIGQPVTLTADLYGSGQVFHGQVAGLASGTGSAFAVLPAQNASGNWIKIVQRVPVRIALDPAELAAHPLRIGLSMRATVDTTDASGTVLAAAPRRDAGDTTPVYAAQEAEVARRIDAIIAANLAAAGK
jgi:membrane fusion protein, multidrug efflux system